MTHALRPDSRAIDRGGIGIGFVGFDQRGELRPQGFAFDVGAFESPFTLPYWETRLWERLINGFEIENILRR
jgi:hypothetical protein